MWWLLIAPFIVVHGPEGQIIALSSDGVVSLRQVRPNAEDYIVKGLHCIVYTADGKYVNTVETCDEIGKLLEESR